MTTGHLYPYSAVVTTGLGFPGVHYGTGSAPIGEEGLQVAGSITGNVVWALRFQLPPVVPAGTAEIRMMGLCTGGGNAKIAPSWRMVNTGVDPTNGAYFEEGTGTVPFSSATTNSRYVEYRTGLDATTIVGNQVLAMNLKFDSDSWTLTGTSTWNPYIRFS